MATALKADTSKVVWAGGSAGGADHILAGLVAKASGGDASKLNYVPFSGGGQALPAIYHALGWTSDRMNENL